MHDLCGCGIQASPSKMVGVSYCICVFHAGLIAAAAKKPMMTVVVDAELSNPRMAILLALMQMNE
jgi:hypothetical protein